MAEAVAHWRKVRALVATIPEDAEGRELATQARAQLIFAGARIGMAEEELRSLFEESRDASRAGGEPATEAILLLGYASARVYADAAEEALEYVEQAKRAADQLGDHALRIFTRFIEQTANAHLNRWQSAIDASDEVDALCASEVDPASEFMGSRTLPASLYARSMTLAIMGRGDEADEVTRRLVALADGSDDFITRLTARMAAALQWGRKGDAGRARSEARRAIELAEQRGPEMLRAAARYALCEALLHAQCFDEAAQALEEALAFSRDHRVFPAPEVLLVKRLADAYAGMENWPRARARAEEAIALARSKRRPTSEQAAHVSLARVLLATEGEPACERATALLDRAAPALAAAGMRVLLPTIEQVRAELASMKGDAAAREQHLREAERLYRDCGLTGAAERVARELAS
jgi:tetratricopeptide (TPR) repeat protein